MVEALPGFLYGKTSIIAFENCLYLGKDTRGSKNPASYETLAHEFHSIHLWIISAKIPTKVQIPFSFCMY